MYSVCTTIYNIHTYNTCLHTIHTKPYYIYNLTYLINNKLTLGNEASRATSSNRGCSIHTPSPVGIAEVLALSQQAVAVEYYRSAFECITVLVSVKRHGGDTREREVEIYMRRSNSSSRSL